MSGEDNPFDINGLVQEYTRSEVCKEILGGVMLGRTSSLKVQRVGRRTSCEDYGQVQCRVSLKELWRQGAST